ncbi:MAG: penicillin-binding protein activator [Gammaproteobacteria bacterium]|nr:penicillin-binding protein activator [Gammaproteobacteria bacterium]
MKTHSILVLSLCMVLVGCSTLLGKGKSTSGSSSDSATSVALVLPLNNASLKQKASAVRDGFFAAYYQAPGQTTVAMAERYDDVNVKKTRFIVGPLEKSEVRKAAEQAKSVPTLALNYTDVAKLPSHFYEFGLSPMDEVQQVVTRAWHEGHRKALVIVSGDAWGRGIAQAFSSDWKQLGGAVVHTMLLGKQQNVVDQLQALVPSRGDKNKLTMPDFDVVLLAALPDQARSVTSMFRFYGLVNIPIYATSSVYSGMPSPADKDLDGVRLCDIPWVVHPTTEMINATRQLQASHSEAGFDIRLYALGLDAYRLIPELPRLSRSPRENYRGVTGVLTLENHRIRRVLAWGQFINGQIVPLY